MVQVCCLIGNNFFQVSQDLQIYRFSNIMVIHNAKADMATFLTSPCECITLNHKIWKITKIFAMHKSNIWSDSWDLIFKNFQNLTLNKANLRDLIALTDLVILLKLDSNCQFFIPWPWIWWMTLKKQYDTSFILSQILCIISKPLVNLNLSYSPETLNSGKNSPVT